MATTYTPIASQTLGSATTTQTFSSIPATYTDLIVIINGSATAATSLYSRVNGDTATNYSNRFLSGNGTTATSSTSGINQNTFVFDNVMDIGTTVENMYILQYMNYSNTTTYKTVLGKASAASTGFDASVGLWRSTAAINSITLTALGTTWKVGTTFTLYGITCA